MTDKIDAFLNEVRNIPGLIRASAADPEWFANVEGIERGLNTLDRLANEDPAMLDIFDKVQATMGRADLSTKEKLLLIVKLFVQVRDIIKIVH